MKKELNNALKLINNPLLLKEFFITNGVNEVSQKKIYNTKNSFSIEDNNPQIKLVEYQTTATLELCLSFLFQKLSKSEIKQMISMFRFHYQLFNDIIEDDPISIMCTDTTIIFNSKIIDLMITQEHCNIQQESAFFKRSISLSMLNFNKITIEKCHKMITSQLKISLSQYCKKTINNVNVKVINNVLNESIDDYNKRINNQPFFKDYDDYDFFVNIKNRHILYKTVALKDYHGKKEVDPLSDLNENCELVIFKFNPEKKDKETVINRITMHDQVALHLHAKNIKTLRKLLTPVFHERDLSYLLSIISLFNFNNQIKYPYDNKIPLIISKDPKKMFSKEDAYTNISTFTFSCMDFNMSVGKETGVENLDFTYKNNDFEKIYKKLCEYTVQKLAESLDVDVSELTYQHVNLEQMKNA
jgi:hypothetical protein